MGNGVCTKAVRTNAVEALDYRLYELSSRATNGDQMISFDFRVAIEPQDANPRNLSFCIFMDVQNRTMRYLGSVLAGGDTPLHSLCFGEICELDANMSDGNLERSPRTRPPSAPRRTGEHDSGQHEDYKTGIHVSFIPDGAREPALPTTYTTELYNTGWYVPREAPV